MAISAPIVLGVTLNMRPLQATDSSKLFTLSRVLRHRSGSLIVATFVVWLISLALRLSHEPAMILALVHVSKCCDSLSDAAYGALQQAERMDVIAKSRLAQGLLQITTFGTLLHSTQNLVTGCFGLALVSLMVTVWYDLPASARASNIRRRTVYLSSVTFWNGPEMSMRLTKISLPLGAAAFLGSLIASVPRGLIDALVGREALGIFSAGAYLATPMLLAQSAINQSALPRLAQYKLGTQEFTILFRKLVLLSLGIGAVALLVTIFAGSSLLKTLYGPDYASGYRVLTLLMGSAVLANILSLLYLPFIVNRHLSLQLLVVTIQLVALVLCLALLARRISVYSVVIAMTAANAIACVVAASITRTKSFSTTKQVPAND